MKAKGSEIRDFWMNYWPENLSDWYFETEESEIQIDDEEGNFILNDTKSYDLKLFSPLFWQGIGECPIEYEYTFEKAFKKYKNISTNVQLVVSIPDNEKDEFLKIISEHSFWKLLK